MRANRFIPPLADPHARLLCLERIVLRSDDSFSTASERRKIRQVARGLYDSLDEEWQSRFRVILEASRTCAHRRA